MSKEKIRNDGGAVNAAVPVVESMMVRVDQIVKGPWNTRRVEGADPELVESIRRHGILQPLSLRRRSGETFELMAGERRLEAAKAAGLREVPATVRDCTDTEAAEICVTENLQREGLTPLEETEAVAALLGMGLDAEEIAARLGKTRQWALRRASLTGLSDNIKGRLADPGDPMRLAHIVTLEKLARMPVEFQDEVAEMFDDESIPTPKEVEELCGRYARVLANAPFDTEGCENCPRRTGAYPDLFDAGSIGDEDACTDNACFNGKVGEAREARIAEFREQHPKGIVISNDHRLYRNKELGIKEGYHFSNCKEGAKGAVVALEVTEGGTAEVVYVRPSCGSGGGGGNADGRERKARMPTPEQKRRAKVLAGFSAHIDRTVGGEAPNPLDALDAGTVVGITVLLGTAVRHDYLSPSSATEWELLGWEPVKVNGLLWKGLAPVIARRIRHTTIVDCDPHYEEAVRVVEKVFLKTKEWLDGFGQEASKE